VHGIIANAIKKSQTGFLLPPTVTDIVFLPAILTAGCHQLSCCCFSSWFQRWIWNSVFTESQERTK